MRNTQIYAAENEKYRVEIHVDDFADDPRTWGDYVDESSPVFQQWKEGNVYGFRLFGKHKCTECDEIHKQEIDACWGFYGLEFENQMNDYLPDDCKLGSTSGGLYIE